MSSRTAEAPQSKPALAEHLQFESKRKGPDGPINILDVCDIGAFPRLK
jgi:hypothetical protein